MPDLAIRIGWKIETAAKMLGVYAALNPGRATIVALPAPAKTRSPADSGRQRVLAPRALDGHDETGRTRRDWIRMRKSNWRGEHFRLRPKAAIFWGWQSHKRGNAVLIFRRAAAAVVRNLRWAGAGPAQRRRRRQPLAAKQPWCAAVGREGWRSASMVAPCDGGRRPLADIASRARRARSSLLGDRVRMVAVDGTMAVTDQPSRANPRPESGSSQDDVSRPTPQSRGRRAPWRALRSPV